MENLIFSVVIPASLPEIKPWQSRNPDHVLEVYNILMQTFLYKQHFYKQRQSKISKKSSKCSTTLLG